MPIVYRRILIVVRMLVGHTAAAWGFARQLISGASHGSPDPNATFSHRLMSCKFFAVRHSFASRLLVFSARLGTGRWRQFHSCSSGLPFVLRSSICDRVVYFVFVHFKPSSTCWSCHHCI